MAPRPSWKGYLKLSLVSCPVALYPASSSSEKVSFHMLNAETGNRLKQQYVDSDTGDLVERDERVKGYEVSKGDYLVITDEELADIKIESSHTIDIERFVPKTEIDALYFDNNYFLAPDDKVGEEAFAVIREAMEKRSMVGIARVVLFGKERMIMLEPRSKGLVGTTLRYAYEVRAAGAYFDEIPKVEISKELLDLASHIIDTKAGRFEPSAFKDRYQEAVVDLIRAKQTGKPLPNDKGDAKPSNVVNLMDALKRSLGQEGGKAEPKTLQKESDNGAEKKPVAKKPTAKKPAAKTASRSAAKTVAATTKRSPARKAS